MKLGVVIMCLGVIAGAGCGRTHFEVKDAEAPTTDGADGTDAAVAQLMGLRIPGGWGVGTDLTVDGSVDWIHWGFGGTAAYNRKQGVTPLIANYTHLGGGFVGWGDVGSDPLSWTDGTPIAIASNVVDYIYLDTAGLMGDGFEILVSADTTRRSLSMFVAQWCVRVRFEAELDDGVTSPYVDTSWEIGTPRAELGRYEVVFRAAATGTVRVRVTVDFNHCTTGDVGEVWLIAATLADVPQ